MPVSSARRPVDAYLECLQPDVILPDGGRLGDEDDEYAAAIRKGLQFETKVEDLISNSSDRRRARSGTMLDSDLTRLGQLMSSVTVAERLLVPLYEPRVATGCLNASATEKEQHGC